MKFRDIADTFHNAASGTDAFKALSHDAFHLIAEDETNAGLYFVIGVAAKAFVSRYEDQPITGAFADSAKATLERFNASIVKALESDPATRLRLLGEVVAEYQLRVKDF